MPSKKDDLVVELLQEIREDQKSQSGVLHEHSILLMDVKKDVEQNTQDLREHKEGVIQNRVRIEKLEEPRIFLKHLKKILIGVGAVAGAIYMVLRLLGKI